MHPVLEAKIWVHSTDFSNPIQIQQVHSEGDQPWDFFGRNDAKAETPVLWPPHVKSWLIGKHSDAGRDWGQEEKGTTEGEMAGWHHRLDGCESEWTLGVVDGQGGLACCNSWGLKESDTPEWLNWTESNTDSWIGYTFQFGDSEKKIKENSDLFIFFSSNRTLVFMGINRYESWTVKKAECWRVDALNFSVGEDTWESLGLHGGPTSPS